MGDGDGAKKNDDAKKNDGDASASSKVVELHGEPVNAAGGHRPRVVYDKNDDTGEVIPDSGKIVDVKGSHYCPGCGLRYAKPSECVGTAEAPHEAIATAPVSELSKAKSEHTAAPATGDSV